MSDAREGSGDEINVSEDNDLIPEERQVSLAACKADDSFQVHCEVASVTKRLLHHSEFDVIRTQDKDGEIVAVTGSSAISAVSLKAESRQSPYQEQVVSGGVLQ